MNPLGQCETCHGHLCIDSGGRVKCEACGRDVPGHPMAEPPDTPRPAPLSTNIPAHENGATVMDRVLALERLAASQAARLAALEASQRSGRKGA